MNSWRVVETCVCLSLYLSSVLAGTPLYNQSDHVIILTINTFDSYIYNQPYGVVVEFYDNNCGDCIRAAPKIKKVGNEIKSWKNTLRLGVYDCSIYENSDFCMEHDIINKPTMLYFHDNYVKNDTSFGEESNFQIDTLKQQFIGKIEKEQSIGRLINSPPLNIVSYRTFSEVRHTVPNDVLYIFVVFESKNSSVGQELALDISNYKYVAVRRAYDTSELAKIAGIKQFPDIFVIDQNLQGAPLTPKEPTKINLFREINRYLSSKHYEFPLLDSSEQADVNNNNNLESKESYDVVFYSDLEAAIRESLNTSIPYRKDLSLEDINAALIYLNALVKSFPFKGNLQKYLQDLRDNLSAKPTWSGREVKDLFKRVQLADSPWITNLEYVSCKESKSSYFCGLWVLFHTLTVNAALRPGLEGPAALISVLVFVKNFLPCTHCRTEFVELAETNKIHEVKTNYEAVLWLWDVHNIINKELAPDDHGPRPKIQFPSATNCPACRNGTDAENITWNRPIVYKYLVNMYRGENLLLIKTGGR